jgi:hypothetical protein
MIKKLETSIPTALSICAYAISKKYFNFSTSQSIIAMVSVLLLFSILIKVYKRSTT